MNYKTIGQFLSRGQTVLRDGPVALIFVEDEVEVESTITHHLELGFRSVIVFADDTIPIAATSDSRVHRIIYDMGREDATERAINAVIKAAPGTWFYYCYNAEYLFFPFCESRTVGEMLTFHSEERRDAMVTYVVDLYSDEFDSHENAVSLDEAHLDTAGYYALARKDAEDRALDRQLDFFGGLRCRFEEHTPADRRRIDRVGLFRAANNLRFRADHTFNEEEYNTFECPWHHNLTAAICSFRAAKALRQNAGSRSAIDTFKWHNSARFEWHSQQLLDLGLIEPGQWF